MAKELPYFKFEPNQWENGNIQMLSREDKGLFIDLCSMYWSRLGDVPLKLAIQKLCGGNASAFDLLCEENIIQVVDNNIFIKFLSEQINTFENTSEQNSRNALDGWEKRRKQKKIDADASALIPQSESDAIREEKSKEEKIRKEEIDNTPLAVKFSFLKSLLELGISEQIAKDWLQVRKLKKLANTETAFKNLIIEFDKKIGKSPNEIIENCVIKSWGGFNANWEWEDINKNNNSKTIQDERITEIAGLARSGHLG